MRDRPVSALPHDLGFTPQPMVEWLAPGELLNASLRVMLSSVFGAYADKRELQGVGPMVDAVDYSHLEEMWIDYVADVADGFDATMTVAAALAMPKLDLSQRESQWRASTRRGDVLVMGGDQVYPTANFVTYRHRLIGPYRSAFPAVEGPAPDLFAIPGNHDWYDGLTAFLRVFCQGEKIGAWQTRQRRSYFALKLPHRWWLWAIDVQLDSYLDPHQLHYFRDVMGPQLEPGDSIVLCSATPSWLDSNVKDVDAYENIDFLAREVAEPHGAEIRFAIAGDKHHYARYQEVAGGRGRQHVTSGGGGAYLAATHHLPKKIVVPHPESTDLDRSPPAEYELKRTYPSAPESRRLRWGVLRLPWHNGSFWGLAAIGYVIIGWTVLLGLRLPSQPAADMLRSLRWNQLIAGLFTRPLGFLMTVGLVAGLAAFARSPNPVKRWGLGTGHAVAHLILVLSTVWGITRLLSGLDDGPLIVATTLMLGVVGGLLGSWLVSIYLLVAEIFGTNINELFAAQHIAGYNNFLRLRITPDGALTIYPVKVQKVVKWKFQPEGDRYTPWFIPDGDPPDPHLIEAPIRFGPLKKPARRESPDADTRPSDDAGVES